MPARQGLVEHWTGLVRGRSGALTARAERSALALASFFYGAGTRLRNAGYDRGLFSPARLPFPVLSVGNLSLGGTGKTSLVIWCLDYLRARGRKAAVASRGYGRISSGIQILTGADRRDGDADRCGDEPAMIARRSPGAVVAVGPDRARALEAARGRHDFDCAVLDDGFQHRALHRDLDIVCIDEATLQAPRMFPAGGLREGVGSLDRAGLVVAKTGRSAREFAADFERAFARPLPAPAAFFAYGARDLVDNESGETVAADRLAGQPAAVFCGIAQPEDFEGTVAAAGALVKARLRFPDHHRYRREDLDALRGEAKARACRLVTTEKDRERLPAGFPCLVLRARMEWRSGREELERNIMEALARYDAQKK